MRMGAYSSCVLATLKKGNSMKSIFAALSLLLMITSAEARELRSVPALVKQLEGALVKASATKVKRARTPRELFENYYMKLYELKEVDEDFEFQEWASGVEEADGSAMGTLHRKEATQFLTSVIRNTLNSGEDGLERSPAELRQQAKQVAEILQALDKAGAIFGFNESGSGVCGVTYATFIVIDPATGVFYEFSFVDGPC